MEAITTEIVVIGAGPGGYAAAFYAADMGRQVTLIEKDSVLGGVCLNRGCIPSKALLHATKVIRDAREGQDWGIDFGEPRIDREKLAAMKTGIVGRLNTGIAQLARQRKIRVITGSARFVNASALSVTTTEGEQPVHFKHCIIAAGSSPAMPGLFKLNDSDRIMTSTEALDLRHIPDTLLVIGGGVIGMELGSVYAGLGSEVTVIEAQDTIIPGADADLIRPFSRYTKSLFREVHTGTLVNHLATKGSHIRVTSQKNGQEITAHYDRVLVSVGRTANSAALNLAATRVTTDDQGYIRINAHCQTAEPTIYAIGDIAGGMQLAHKASKEARIAVDTILGKAATHDGMLIPSVVYTDPEIAWVGLTEAEAKASSTPVKVTKFPWAACGRSLSLNRNEGMTKLIVDPETDRILGVGIVGPGAGDLISEAAVVVSQEMTAQQLGNVIHPHPTLSETLMEAAHAVHGTCSHIFVPKRPVRAPA